MKDLLVITPSRGRPHRLREMLDACLALGQGDIEIAVGCDDDDLAGYRELAARYPGRGRVRWFAGPRLPTAAVVSADIVAALGWMCEPSLQHMFVDNVWADSVAYQRWREQRMSAEVMLVHLRTATRERGEAGRR